ncbi:helix-turn-helix transcriptional regulator [Paenibacillus yanchengensis]|uniref:Helix-turn-helix transcriptional regulator n=1 Tax=Paenibacillus yanchengensis TaxID=2035833 RepID=A0ABW4YPF6_9BACL
MVVRKKFLYKVLTLFIVIVLLYTITTSSIIFYKSMQTVNTQNNYNHQLYIDQTSNYADFKFQTAMEFVYKVSTLQSVIDYRHSDAKNYYTITTLYNDLVEQLRGFSQLGFTLGITKLTDNLIITSTGTFNIDHYLQELGMLPTALERFQQLQTEALPNRTYVVPQTLLTANKVVLLHQTVNSEYAPLYFFLVMDNAALLPTPVDLQDGNFYLFTDEKIAAYISDEDVTENSKLTYTQQSKVIPNLHYVYASKPTSFATIFASVWNTAFFPSLLLLVIGVIAAYLATRSSYKPIKQLLEFLNEHHETRKQQTNNYRPTTDNSPETIPIHELAYIQASIEQIYEVNDALQNKLDHSIIHLQEDFFRRVLYGMVNEASIQESLAANQLEAFDTSLYLVLFEIEGLTTVYNTMSVSSLTIQLHHIISEHVATETFFGLALDQNKYAVIFRNIDKQHLLTIAEKVVQNLENKLPLDITAALSHSYPLAELTVALQEVLRLSNYQYAAANQVLDVAQVHLMEDNACYYPIDAENQIMKYVNSNELGKAYELLRDIIDENEKRAIFASGGLTNLQHSLLTTCKRCLNTNNKTLQSFSKEYPSTIHLFMEARSNKFREIAFSLFEQVFNYCNKDKVNLESSTASQIYIYIHKHFDRDLSLTDIADHFNLSESYVSKLLKNTLNINFKQYVNTLKVNRAKELLMQQTYKVHEVATIVGCNNTNTFIRIFKQYEGISPGEYMKSLE